MDQIRRISALRALLLRLSAHSSLSADEEGEILALPATTSLLKAHTDFVRAGEKLDHSCLVEEGLVARFDQLDDGRRQIISLHIPGDLVDLQSLLLPSAPNPLQAICPSSVVNIPHTALLKAIARRPNLGMALWRDTALDAATMTQAVVRVGRRDAYARLAHLICEMAVRYRRVGRLEGLSFKFPIRQEQLGDAVGLTSVHVNRMLRALRENGLVTLASSRFTILDWEGLQQAAGFDPVYLAVPPAGQAIGHFA